jgi:Glycosyl hydrolase family 59/Galactocerebrosidase, C-terminal lectin domain/Glycosyl hydrolase family 59 central domain
MRVKEVAVAAAASLLSISIAQAPPPAATVPTTSITVNGNHGGRVYDGVGAILGAGTSRYLVDYPPAQRASILDYLYKPDYGASLQLLKLEIGGDGDSSSGSEPSVEHTRGTINCGAGYEMAIARQAVAVNPDLKLYALQWVAPSWVGSRFSNADIGYLLDWLRCATRNGLTISYLGGWDERDPGTRAGWWHRLRQALNANGYSNVQLVAGDRVGLNKWQYTSSPDVAILGAHDNCGYPTGYEGPLTKCESTSAARSSGKPLWASELGRMDAGMEPGCQMPADRSIGTCASAMDRAFVREYSDARVTGVLTWPEIDSMPAVDVPYQNRGLVTAEQPWSGSYQVNAMTWAIAQITQFASPPTASDPGGWRYLNSASGFLQGHRTDGSYVTLVRSSRDQWSTIIETTDGVTKPQQASFTVTGGHGLASKTVHVWSSNFNLTAGPAQWFVRQPDITPVNGKFTLTIQPGYVYSLTTTTGQGKGTATGPAAVPLNLPYHNNLSAGADGEATMLAAEDGSFELAPCHSLNGSTTCTEQTAVGQPLLWVRGTVRRHPYAIIGSDWSNYVVSVDVMVPHAGSAGLLGRYDAVSPVKGTFDGYIFDVNTNGTFTLKVSKHGSDANTEAGQRQLTPRLTTLARGPAPFSPGTWHRLSLSVSGSTITAKIDGKKVASLSDSSFTSGMPGIEVGGWYPAYFSNLKVTAP